MQDLAGRVTGQDRRAEACRAGFERAARSASNQRLANPLAAVLGADHELIVVGGPGGRSAPLSQVLVGVRSEVDPQQPSGLSGGQAMHKAFVSRRQARGVVRASDKKGHE